MGLHLVLRTKSLLVLLLRLLTRSLHSSLHAAVGHRHAVRVHLLMGEGCVGILHACKELANTLGMANGTILVLYEQISQISDFVMESGDLAVE